MLSHNEIHLALTKMAVAATRRIGEDQARQMAELWQGELAGVERIGFQRATHAYVQEGKLPSIGEFRTRAKGMTPRPPGTSDEGPDEGPPRCPVGHAYVWRNWTNANRTITGSRPWCPCANRASEMYGETWGRETAPAPVDEATHWDALVPRIGRPVPGVSDGR